MSEVVLTDELNQESISKAQKPVPKIKKIAEINPPIIPPETNLNTETQEDDNDFFLTNIFSRVFTPSCTNYKKTLFILLTLSIIITFLLSVRYVSDGVSWFSNFLLLVLLVLLLSQYVVLRKIPKC